MYSDVRQLKCERLLFNIKELFIFLRCDKYTVVMF